VDSGWRTQRTRERPRHTTDEVLTGEGFGGGGGPVGEGEYICLEQGSFNFKAMLLGTSDGIGTGYAASYGSSNLLYH